MRMRNDESCIMNDTNSASVIRTVVSSENLALALATTIGIPLCATSFVASTTYGYLSLLAVSDRYNVKSRHQVILKSGDCLESGD